MNVQVLIDSIVRQVTVLIAELATSGGIRAPLAHLANQVFLELANELEAQGVSRKVSADMFGMALRAYIRKVRRLSEAQTERGRTLWQALLDFVRTQGLVSRQRVLQRFEPDGEVQVSAVLHDLIDSGLVFSSGSGRAAVLRAATDEDLGRLSELAEDSGIDELAWVLIYRNGPITPAKLTELLTRAAPDVDSVVERLVSSGRVRRNGEQLVAQDFSVPLGSTVGWEAAVFDHFQAMVQTICQRLQGGAGGARARDEIGGSTYSFDVFPGHPLDGEVRAQLGELRARMGALRERVDEHNRAHPLPNEYQQIMTYIGQCVIEREQGSVLENAAERSE